MLILFSPRNCALGYVIDTLTNVRVSAIWRRVRGRNAHVSKRVSKAQLLTEKGLNSHVRALFLTLCSFLAGSVFSSVAVYGQTAASVSDKERGIQLFQQNDARNAVRLLEMVTKATPQDAEAWHYLGLSFALQKDFKKAGKAFIKALQVEPKRLDTRESLISVFLRDNKFKEAEQMAKQTLALALPSATANYALALILLNRNLPDEGMEYLEKAISINPEWGLLYLLRYRSILTAIGKGMFIGQSSKKPAKFVRPTKEEIEQISKARSLRYRTCLHLIVCRRTLSC